MLFYFESGEIVERQAGSKVVGLTKNNKRPLSLLISKAEYDEINKNETYYKSLQNSVRQPIIVAGENTTWTQYQL